jgi:hypothetical protein
MSLALTILLNMLRKEEGAVMLRLQISSIPGNYALLLSAGATLVRASPEDLRLDPPNPPNASAMHGVY